MAYFFKVGVLTFILNVQTSAIGFSYPRVFISYPDNSFLNVDLFLGQCFSMTESDFMSWLDGEEIRLDTIEEVREIFKENGVDWETFSTWAFDSLNKATSN